MDREKAKKRAEALVAEMTVEEAASQLRYDSPAIDRLDIPEYNWWNEALHGVARAGTATVFPQAIGLGATFDAPLLRQIGHAAGMEARAKYNEALRHEDRDIYKGLTFWSPNVNLFRDPRWGRGQETYGEDPVLISDLGVSFIRGLQGEGETLLAAACAKHFAVHSGPEALRHGFDARVSEKDMRETYLPAFQACVQEAGVEAVMGAYNRVNGEPCCGHPLLMEQILREEWGFQGHFVSDCWAIRDFHGDHGVTKTAEESAALALNRGCDVNCGCTYQKIMEAYADGLISEETIRRAAVRLFTTRFLLGMFDETGYDAIPYETVDCEEHRQLALRAAEESIVLLKNDGILPLDRKKIHTLGVIGPNADSRAALAGNYHGTASRYITVLEGIEDLAGEEIRVLYSSGCHLFQDREEHLAQEDDRLSEALAVAEHADVSILVLGLDETLEGEEGDTGNSYASGDKPDLLLPEPQRKLLETVLGTGKPVVVLMMTGSAMDLSLADEKASAVLQVWYPGGRGGLAAARVLFGEAEPGGRLPVTFYRSTESLPEFTDYSMKGRTYRYLSEKPLYPFGYGLSYGQAEMKYFEVKEIREDGILVRAVMENPGDRPVSEILQVYAQAENAGDETPHPHLAAFARVRLAPHEETAQELLIRADRLMVVNQQGIRVREGDGIVLRAGFSQPDERSRELTGRQPLSCRIKW